VLTPLVVIAALAATAWAADAQDLSPAAPIERTIAAGEVHTYTLPLEAGEFVHVVVRQQGIDLAASLTSADGRTLVSVDAFDDSFRDETVVAIAGAAGAHILTIAPAPNAEPSGRYRIILDAMRPQVAGDDLRVSAERAFAHALSTRSREQAPTLTASLSELEETLAVYRHLGDRRGEMKTLIEIGATQYYLLQDDALATSRLAEAAARALGDAPATARALRLLGNILVWRGDLRAAAASLEEATALSRADGNLRGEVRSLNETGRVYRRIGELERAVGVFERALALEPAANVPEMRGTLLGNLGLVFKVLGDHTRARAVYEETLTIARRLEDLRGQMVTLINLGNLDRIEAKYDAALNRHREALALARQMGSTSTEASTLGAIGLTYQEQGEHAAALALFEEALAIRRRVRDVTGVATSLVNIGQSRLAQGDAGAAIASLDEALQLQRRLYNQAGEADALFELGRAERARGHHDVALAHVRDAVALDERLRRQITSPELRAAFGSTGADKYEVLVDLLHARAADESEYEGAAFEVSERARARVLLESLLEARVDLREGVDAGLLARERTLQRELADAATAFSSALTQGSTSGREAAAEQLQRLSTDHEDLQRRIRLLNPRYAALTQPQPLTLEQIQREVLDDETVLLEFALGRDRSWLWAVTTGALHSVVLPPARDIQEAAREFYAAVTARQPRAGEAYAAYRRRVETADQQAAAQAGRVSRMLLGGFAAELAGAWRGKRLLIVASGALESLPFAALPLPGGTEPLVARHEIVAVPSASVLHTLRQEAASRAPATAQIAVLADPVFEPTDPRVRGGRVSRGGRLQPAQVSSAGRLEPARTRAGVARLPFSREEAEAIRGLAGPDRVFEAIGFDASRHTALGPLVGTSRIVHFATHGWLDPDRPDLTGLVLSLVDERGAPQNGFLPLRDIYNMQLSADLVVLSACQTALGTEISGEGLVGLTRAFMYAGAPRVIASLWQVSDAATAELMKHLYAGILQKGLTPAAALRAAQLDMSRDRRWSSPYFWSGFVLQGDWR
jgi:CHAT domain-containing protein/tetratricopeptide (TPR) repeat protein